MAKRDLDLRKPLMNAAGTLGFAPDLRAPVPWEDLGAFITNPVSLRPRTSAKQPALIEYPGGFLLHTGLPNPGLQAVIKKYARRWADTPLPIILHLMADRLEETKQMVRSLEGLDPIMAFELGFAPLLADDIISLVLESCLGEAPLIVNLEAEQFLGLGARLIQAGAAALSLAAPRGSLPVKGDMVTGRLFGPGLFPRSLDLILSAARLGLPVIGRVHSMQDAETMLGAGAMGVQVEAGLWLPGKEKQGGGIRDQGSVKERVEKREDD